jgi:hypothetical protein
LSLMGFAKGVFTWLQSVAAGEGLRATGQNTTNINIVGVVQIRVCY